ncbi:MAG: YjjG family noncanonical pyrimidine nucleotidase [Hymenobacteraceae bacterium]|nr:YjjG family noncanonical pyrimidine nucleotidase [Hymenobacteraceae bacterium]MDX5396401.1 YjjG family noncanonical pyrimidine nucleotidase [Hymenobacteraceae bacterium]MDX5512463.1 YjjG family noncanonical pyrimidine nucleotidase [Hymenobacteraceae bacterium]
MKKYRHLFFDLDHTLWDFEKNSEETLFHLYDLYDLGRFGTFDKTYFYKKYKNINHQLWVEYTAGKISQEELREARFVKTLKKLGLKKSDIPKQIADDYVAICPTKSALFPFTHETLGYLRDKYTLHIITNGFKDVQHIKLNSSNLYEYFNEVITSECCGYKKPQKQIFEHALQRCNVTASECLMIGDNLDADILGARAAGIDQVYFNPDQRRHRRKITYEITCLSQLVEIL